MSEKKPVRVNRLKEHREKLTNQIVEALESGEKLPWQKPWDATMARPFNPLTGTRYAKGNLLSLIAEQQHRESADPRWMTQKQIEKMGYSLREGAKGAGIEYWTFKSKAKAPQLDADGQPVVPDEDEELNQAPARPLAVYHLVYNGEDIEGLPPLVVSEREFSPHAMADRLINATGAVIEHKAQVVVRRDLTLDCSAYYSPTQDKITLPPRAAFHSENDYYSTLLHELAHWTGHASRLNRFDESQPAKFGSPDYAKEELRAEIGAYFLKTMVGVSGESMNHVSYVGSWLEVLKDDVHEIYRASKDASLIVDHLLALDPALEAEIEAMIEANLVKLPTANQVNDAELVSPEPLPFDTTDIVVPTVGINENDPRFPAFLEQVNQTAKQYAIEPAAIAAGIATIASSFTEILDTSKENGYDNDEVIALIAHQMVSDLRAESIRENRWSFFENRVHEIGDAVHGKESIDKTLSVMTSHYRGIIAEGVEQKLSQETIDANVRQFIYGTTDRRPVDADFIAQLVDRFNPAEPSIDFDDDLDISAHDSSEAHGDDLPFEVSHQADESVVATVDGFDEFSDSEEFTDSVQLSQ